MDLNIVSFNIRCSDDENGHSIDERAPRLRQAVSPLSPDLIELHEDVPKWERHVPACFGDNYAFYHRYRSLDKELESVPLMWRKDRFDCIKTGNFWYSDTPQVESRGYDTRYRICTYAVLVEKRSGRHFTFMNTHFGFGDNGQVASAQLVYEYSKRISDYPTFVIGDFNMKPGSPGYEKMTEYFTDVNAVTARDMRTTYHGYDPAAHPDSHIDYCFVNEKFTPVDQKLIDTQVDGKYPSDHYGLQIHLRCGDSRL